MQPSSGGTLLRVLGVAFGIAAVVGAMVGQGILRTPGIVAGAVHTPGMILLMWVVGAVFVAASACAYMELGTAIPRAGGPYEYVRRAFGPVAANVTGWACWLVMITGQAMLAVVVGEFLHRLGLFAQARANLLGLGVLALFWLVNWTGTRLCGASQVVFSAIKGAVLVALIVVLLAHPGRAAAPQAVEMAGPVGAIGVVVAMRVIVSTYNGWQDIAYCCEELQKPARTLPRSMLGGIAGVAALYLLINIAMLHVLTPQQMAASNLPAANAAAMVLGTRGEVALTMFGVLSVGAITNLKMMVSARIAYALARDGVLPAALAKVAPGGTPRVALTVTTLLSAAFVATGTYLTIIATSTALIVFTVIMANLAAIVLRRREPRLPRPFPMPLYPLPVLLALALNLALLVGFVIEDPVHSLQGLALLVLVGIGYYIAGRRRAAALVRTRDTKGAA